MPGKYIVIGGGGKVALKFASSAVKQGSKVISVVRNDSHNDEITAVGAKPYILSLEDASVKDFVELFDKEKPDGVVFSAGAGGKGGEERTKAVDYEGALKVFDALESSNTHRIVMVSAADLRARGILPTTTMHPVSSAFSPPTRSKVNNPLVWTEQLSDRMYKAIPAYLKWKREADLDLHRRKALQYTIIRPGGLVDEPTNGKCELGTPQLGRVPRETVGEVLLAVMENKNTYGMVLDLMEGDMEINKAVENAVEKGLSSWHD
ncbi:hypothetical protein QFC22_003879 [Naganishia vaughanmartiniae]|uniref:Uncharacterized protein n=1 Tax=Naganishia vaughanmartiniae TaxID=1424756 RepID=A0ACC2X3P8_9TREE|nr:hypothetical protein QFC22_003879 [Naganishia vaughanmartiniae]